LEKKNAMLHMVDQAIAQAREECSQIIAKKKSAQNKLHLLEKEADSFQKELQTTTADLEEANVGSRLFHSSLPVQYFAGMHH